MVEHFLRMTFPLEITLPLEHGKFIIHIQGYDGFNVEVIAEVQGEYDKSQLIAECVYGPDLLENVITVMGNHLNLKSKQFAVAFSGFNDLEKYIDNYLAEMGAFDDVAEGFILDEKFKNPFTFGFDSPFWFFAIQSDQANGKFLMEIQIMANLDCGAGVRDWINIEDMKAFRSALRTQLFPIYEHLAIRDKIVHEQIRSARKKNPKRPIR